MLLAELEPQFYRREVRSCHVGAVGCSTVSEHTEHEFFIPVDLVAEADGVMFLCPKCFVENGSSNAGTHQVLCWQPHVPPDIAPKPGRWKFVGTGYADLTLVAGSSSILLTAGCRAHFFVRNGRIE